MGLKSEKYELIEALMQVDDEQLIRKIRKMLKSNRNAALEASISRALEQSERGEVRSNEEVVRDLREKYGKK